jgi:hypothetical protein
MKEIIYSQSAADECNIFRIRFPNTSSRLPLQEDTSLNWLYHSVSTEENFQCPIQQPIPTQVMYPAANSVITRPFVQLRQLPPTM